ncbi:hypothetical protein [Marinomonas phage CPP1m]|uniref:Uncharacterized protein n=2 Tax=Murciavirus CPP1m TaxID=2733327 RepID=A0A1W5S624_9CAUD|nr:hypothetical protein HOR72_gp49 [Marinomonas phage CPP1m]ARB11241.1 hypothetical protein [Marinomonas phage CPP1m]ARB11291.1 hypothetical protein [Marinomonas phage CPG1g]
MSDVTLSIRTLENFVGGKFVESFLVVDSEGSAIGKKAHTTREGAEVELGSLKYYAEGLAFARATAPEGATEKGLVGKANIVASYLMYVETQENGGAEADQVESEVEAAVEAATSEEAF